MGGMVTQLPMGFSLALLGAGYLVGLAGGIAILLGIFIAWGVAVPYFSAQMTLPAETAALSELGMTIWREKVRFIGAGTIGIAAIWTLITLIKPMAEGMKLSFRALRGGSVEEGHRMEQDLSPRAMIGWTLGMMLMLGLSFHHFVADASISAEAARAV